MLFLRNRLLRAVWSASRLSAVESRGQSDAGHVCHSEVDTTAAAVGMAGHWRGAWFAFAAAALGLVGAVWLACPAYRRGGGCRMAAAALPAAVRYAVGRVSLALYRWPCAALAKTRTMDHPRFYR